MSQLLVVKALIYSRDGRFLLQHRDNKPDIIEPGMWSLFGGGVEGCETLEGALERELVEELGCKPGVLEGELFRWVRMPENMLHVCFPVRFAARDEEIVLSEGQGWAWVTPEELARLPLGSLARENLPHFMNFFAIREARTS